MDANDVVENLWFEAETIRRAVVAAYEAVSGPTPMPSSLTQILDYIATNAGGGGGVPQQDVEELAGLCGIDATGKPTSQVVSEANAALDGAATVAHSLSVLTTPASAAPVGNVVASINAINAAFIATLPEGEWMIGPFGGDVNTVGLQFIAGTPAATGAEFVEALRSGHNANEYLAALASYATNEVGIDIFEAELPVLLAAIIATAARAGIAGVGSWPAPDISDQT